MCVLLQKSRDYITQKTEFGHVGRRLQVNFYEWIKCQKGEGQSTSNLERRERCWEGLRGMCLFNKHIGADFESMAGDVRVMESFVSIRLQHPCPAFLISGHAAPQPPLQPALLRILCRGYTRAAGCFTLRLKGVPALVMLDSFWEFRGDGFGSKTVMEIGHWRPFAWLDSIVTIPEFVCGTWEELARTYLP